MVSCNLGAIASGSTKQLSITLIPDANAVGDVTFSAAGNETDPVPGNGSASLSADPNPVADLSLSTSSPGAPGLGDTFTIVITVSNAGPSSAQNVAVNVSQTGFEILSTLPSQGDCTDVVLEQPVPEPAVPSAPVADVGDGSGSAIDESKNAPRIDPKGRLFSGCSAHGSPSMLLFLLLAFVVRKARALTVC